MVQASRVTFKPGTLATLRRIIRDQETAETFIAEARGAIEAYKSMRSAKSARANRPELKRLHAAAKSYSKAMLRVLDPNHCVPISSTAGAFPRADIRESQRLAGRIARWASLTLEETRPRRRGRSLDGAGIILIRRLADAFKKAGQRASSGDRSRFVQTVEALNGDQKLGFRDTRQKIHSAQVN